MNLTFKEKSLWLTAATLLIGLGFYFVLALGTHRSGINVMPQHVVFFALAVVLLVLTQIIGHVLIALTDRDAATDERDRAIALRATRNGAYVLACGVFFALVTAVVTEGNFLFVHVLLGFWLVAQLAEIGSQLYLYRAEA